MNITNLSTRQTLWSKLKQDNLVQGEMPIEQASETLWYIRAMQGFAGWIAACFLLAFFGTVFSWIFDKESAFALIAIGLTLNTFAYAMFRTINNNEFLHQLGLVFNLCGQLMVAFGVYKATLSFNASYFFILFTYQAIITFAIPNFTSRVLTTWFAIFALFAGFSQLGLFNIATAITSAMLALVWLNDLGWKKHHNLWEPLGHGLAISLLQFNGQLLLDNDFYWWFKPSQFHWINQYSYWLSEALIAAIFINLLYRQAKQYQIKLRTHSGVLIVAGGFLIIAIGHFIIGASGALLLLLIGFIKQRRLLVTLGVIAFLSFIAWYYYHLQLSLLTKSLILLGFGVAFLVGFYLLNLYNTGSRLTLEHLKTKYQMDTTKWITVSAMILVLILVNLNIYKKETILENGKIVLLKLAPADPRSLMQGDYMNLRFAIENTWLDKKEIEAAKQSSGYFVINLDENAVGTFARFDSGQSLNNDQIKMRFRIRHSSIRLATHAFFFQEGTATKFEKAEYGEFRVDTNGELLLNNLRDGSFKVLGLNRPSN